MTNTSLAALVAIAAITASGLLADPARAQSEFSKGAPNGCSGDFVCGDDPSVIATWPLERWDTVRKASKQTLAARAPKAPASTSDSIQIRGALHSNQD